LFHADGPLKHRVGVLSAFVSDRLEHPGGQRIELALNRMFSSQLGILQEGDEQERGRRERGSRCLLIRSAGPHDVAAQPGENEYHAEPEEDRRAREMRRTLRDLVKSAAMLRGASSHWMLQRHGVPV